GPIRFLAIALVLLAQQAGALTRGGHLIAECRVINHLFDVAQAIGPVDEILAGDRSAGVAAAAAVIVEPVIEGAVKVPGATATTIIVVRAAATHAAVALVGIG